MQIEQTKLPSVLILMPKRHSANRGFFDGCWNNRTYAENGVEIDFLQDDHSFNNEVGVIWGMHAATYGQWTGCKLNFQNDHQMLVYEGCLHGFMTLLPNTEIIYKCSDYYVSQTECSLRFDDPDIGVDWPLGQITPILSDKDKSAPLLKDFQSPFTYKGDAV